MEFKLTINMDNATFGSSDEEKAAELVYILNGLVKRVNTQNVFNAILMDTNGNHVGHAWVEETEPSSVYSKA